MAEENIPESPEDRKARHTPGPWEAYELQWSPGWRVFDGNGDYLLTLEIHREPDARLIAAAPDMLQALTRVSEAHDSWAALARPEYGIEFDDPLSDAVKQAREAIAKAEGE